MDKNEETSDGATQAEVEKKPDASGNMGDWTFGINRRGTKATSYTEKLSPSYVSNTEECRR